MLTTGRSHLRSANACLLSVPRTRTTYGEFCCQWTGRVEQFTCGTATKDVTEETFRRQLKTFLFNFLDD